MAAPSLYRVKVKYPYVGYTAIKNLQSVGMSSLGTNQLAQGEPLTQSKDRDLVAALFAGLDQTPGSLMPPRLKWEVQVAAARYLNGFVSRFSAGTVDRISHGLMLTDANDRRLLAEILEDAAQNSPQFALVAARFKNTGSN